MAEAARIEVASRTTSRPVCGKISTQISKKYQGEK